MFFFFSQDFKWSAEVFSVILAHVFLGVRCTSAADGSYTWFSSAVAFVQDDKEAPSPGG